jgi:cell division septation protein DedD
MAATTAPAPPVAARIPGPSGTTAAQPPESAPAPPAASAPSKPPAPAKQYGIAVGTYLNEDRAREEQQKLTASAGMTVRVVTVTEDNVAMYRILLGTFDDRSSAERAASNLIQQGLVDEARVTALATPRPARR